MKQIEKKFGIFKSLCCYNHEGIDCFPADYNEETLFKRKMNISKSINITMFKESTKIYFKDITQIISVLLFH